MSTLSTFKTLPAGSRQDTAKTGDFAASAGANETPAEKPSTTSAQEVKGFAAGNSKPLPKNSTPKKSGKPTQDTMTRAQALQVAWTGIEALAKAKQAVLFNSKTRVLWIGIPETAVDGEGRLIDLLEDET